jgi:hypothetical protein
MNNKMDSMDTLMDLAYQEAPAPYPVSIDVYALILNVAQVLSLIYLAQVEFFSYLVRDEPRRSLTTE